MYWSCTVWCADVWYELILLERAFLIDPDTPPMFGMLAEGVKKYRPRPSIARLECFKLSLISVIPSIYWFSSSYHWASLACRRSLTYLWVTLFHSFSIFRCYRYLQNLCTFRAAISKYRFCFAYFLKSSNAFKTWVSLTLDLLSCWTRLYSFSSNWERFNNEYLQRSTRLLTCKAMH